MAALLGDGIQRDRVRFLSYLFYVGDRKKDRSAPTTRARLRLRLVPPAP